MWDNKNNEMFSSRQRIRRWKSFSGIFHLVTVSSFVLAALWILPQLTVKTPLQLSEEFREQLERRQLLLEALDKMVRYQQYYSEVHGRFTRDITRLSLPASLSSGKQEELKRTYEISVLEVRPNRFLILATGVGNSDRITIDESHRINSNFVLPAPTRSYLHEEADRFLRLKAHGLQPGDGIVSRYWKVDSGEGQAWTAVGVRAPVLGERREISEEAQALSLFESIKEKVQARLINGRFPPPRRPASVEQQQSGRYKEFLLPKDVHEWLEAAHLAQHVHMREKGRFANRWEDLDTVSDYRFAERARSVKNLRVQPIDLNDQQGGYRLTLEGTSGDLMGEQFIVDGSGSIRQVRYTETLIEQLQKTTNILENFQINPIIDDPSPRSRP